LADVFKLAETIITLNEFSTSGPNAFLGHFTHVSIIFLEAFWSSLVPLVGGWWMAEVALEQFIT
jgi:hypothetical protein